MIMFFLMSKDPGNSRHNLQTEDLRLKTED